MEVKLESLIEKIKKDGVQEAKRMAQEIIDAAKKQAADIVKEANSQAQKIKEISQEEIESFRKNTENSLKKAARDLILTLREEIVSLFDKVLKKKISEQLKPEFITELIIKIVDILPAKKDKSLEVLISDKETGKLKNFLITSLKESKKDIEIKTSKAIEQGFRIGIKGDNIYYDFTDEAIAQALEEFLNPAISEMLKNP
ncbi:MAG: hypothetical protein KBB01_02750 [Candidatus Omnitrophica bacterium]|jgi:V/A-type H+-transporting ATPase subunit E|nr:hypothetical protein [Candidatus Omnitrophota bacterium]